jgi:hypothetical protein
MGPSICSQNTHTHRIKRSQRQKVFLFFFYFVAAAAAVDGGGFRFCGGGRKKEKIPASLFVSVAHITSRSALV